MLDGSAENLSLRSLSFWLLLVYQIYTNIYMSYVSTQLVSSAVNLQLRRNYGWDHARLASAAKAADVSEDM